MYTDTYYVYILTLNSLARDPNSPKQVSLHLVPYRFAHHNDELEVLAFGINPTHDVDAVPITGKPACVPGSAIRGAPKPIAAVVDLRGLSTSYISYRPKA